jgi:hypothetical protein
MAQALRLKFERTWFEWLGFPLLLLLVISIPELLEPGFYYYDDVRHFFLPSIAEAGRQLWAGEFPWISLRSWYSGNLIGEGQLSLLNPLNLLLYAACAKIDDLEMAAFLFAGSYLFLTGLGVFFLARTYRIPSVYAALAAITYCSSSFFTYFYAASWWNALTATCWLVWAWACWVRLLQGQAMLLPTFVCTTFLLSAGWPHGALSLGIVVVASLIVSGRQALNPVLFFRILLVGCCSIAASLLAIYPLLATLAGSKRAAWGIISGPEFAGSLEYFLAASWPSYIASARIFFNESAQMPSFYLGWFVVPPLLMKLWAKDGFFADKDVKPLLIVFTVLALLSLGPQFLFAIRWPLRFLPSAHVCLLLMACMALARSAALGRADKQVWGAYFALGFVLSCLLSPVNTEAHALMLLLAVLSLAALVVYGHDSKSRGRLLIGTTLVFAVAFHFVWPRNPNVTDWSVPLQQVSPAIDAASPPSGNSRLTLLQGPPPCDTITCLLVSGAAGLWEEGRMVNGYTPMAFKGYADVLGFNLWSWSKPQYVENYFKRDAESGLMLFELMRINEFRAAYGTLNKAFEQHRQGEWLERRYADGVSYQRVMSGKELPGTLSWVGAGLTVAGLSASTLEERVTIQSNVAPSARHLVFARAWYPGYMATIDGQPLPLKTYAGLLVSVSVPPGLTGELALRFKPPGHAWTLPLALAAILLLIGAAAWQRWRRGGSA